VKGIDINVRGVHLAEEQKVNTLSANADTPLGKGD